MRQVNTERRLLFNERVSTLDDDHAFRLQLYGCVILPQAQLSPARSSRSILRCSAAAGWHSWSARRRRTWSPVQTVAPTLACSSPGAARFPFSHILVFPFECLFLFLLSSGASRASGSSDPELHGDSVNQPARATQKARELLVRVRGVGDDQVADRLVRLRCAHSLHEANVNHFGARSFDLAVSTHNYPSERGIEKLIATSLAIYQVRKIPTTLGI
jgi:hypothetical protein